MNLKKFVNGVILVVFFILYFFPAISFAETQKVKVIVENSSVRAKPNIQSEVVIKPEAGDVFEVDGKEGEWYKIKFLAEADVFITGFIHEMFVETIKSTKVVPVKKTPPPKTPSTEMKGPRGEVIVRVGYNLSYATTDDSTFSGSISEGLLSSASASGRISGELNTPVGFDGAFNYYFLKGLGVQVRIDGNSKAKFSGNSLSDYQLNWSWINGGSFSAEEEWPLNGDLSVTVISGNVIYKVQGSGMLIPFLSGGVSYFSGNVKANTHVGYAYTWEIVPFQYIDYFEIPAKLDESISGVGFNIGGGLDFAFSKSVAVNIDARYFVRGSFESRWNLQPGTYTSNIQEGWTLTLSQAEMDILEQAISPFKLNLSFFKISLGLKFLF